MAKSHVFALGVTFLLTAIAVAQDTTATKSQPQPCSAPEQKQMDFWLGDWELTWPGSSSNDTGHGTNSIKRILDGCIVEENFSGGEFMHLRGRSVSVFDARAGRWKQTWVDNEGGYLDFIGEFKDGQMVLAREAVRPDGSKVQQRMVFKNIGRGSGFATGARPWLRSSSPLLSKRHTRWRVRSDANSAEVTRYVDQCVPVKLEKVPMELLILLLE